MILVRPAAFAAAMIRAGSRPPGFPVSIKTDSLVGVTINVEPPPSESIQ